MPFYQARRDAFDCDTVCYGRYTSLRSFLSLIGSFICGRLSDRFGRISLLYLGVAATLVGLCFSMVAKDVFGLYLAMIPGALFQNNFSVSKAYFADYAASVKGGKVKDEEVAGLVGKLGMSVGVSFMIGPMLGGMLVKTFEGGVVVALVITFLSGVCVSLIPRVNSSIVKPKKKTDEDEDEKVAAPFLDLTPLSRPGPRIILLLRVLMAMAFHCFMTPWTPSLKERFDFGPSQHGTFMSFVGLVYALSQGFAAKAVIKLVGRNDVILVASSVFLSMGRVVAMGTTDLRIVYVCFFFIIISLGVTNTVISSTLNTLAPPDKIGGLIGLVGSFESLAGMLGPIIGGYVHARGGKEGTLWVVCLCYAAVAVTAKVGWRKSCEGIDGWGEEGKGKEGKAKSL